MQHLEAGQGGSITVRNEGGYVARFSLTYVLGGINFSTDSGNFTYGQSKSLPIPAGATDIHLKVEVAIFIGVWSTIFTQNFAAPVTKCYKIWGITLKPKWEEISCS